MNKKHLMLGFNILFVLSLLVLPLAVGAVEDTEIERGLEELRTGGVELGARPLPETVASIINVGLGLLGIVAVVIIIAGGFLWMTAAGDTEKIGKARSLIFGGIIGLAIILSSYAIAQFVISKLVEATI